VIGGIDIRKKFNLDRYRRISAGAGLYLGSDLVNVPEAGLHQSNFIWAVNPSFTFDQRWIGFKAGLVFGTFYFSGQEKDVEPDNANYDGALKPFHFMPQLGLRLGPYDLFYAEVKAFDHVPPIDPLYPFTFGIGSGLGKVNGTKISVGYSMSHLAYVEGYFPIHDKVVIQGSIAGNFQLETNQKWSASLGICFRFNYQEKERTRR